MDVERQSRFDYPAGSGAHRIRYFNDVPNTYYKHNTVVHYILLLNIFIYLCTLHLLIMYIEYIMVAPRAFVVENQNSYHATVSYRIDCSGCTL